MRKLIIHIGTGKTGISSIRSSANKSISTLSQHNLFYLGKFFEHSPTSQTLENNWLGKGVYHLRDNWSTTTEHAFHKELGELILNLPDGSTCFILNESLHHLHFPFALSLKKFEEKSGIQIRIKSYARNHASYSVSAYKQWGLKHKTNTGPTLSYSDWCKMKKKLFICYGHQLNEWKNVFQDNMNTYNYDLIDNAVVHFQNILRLESRNQLVALDKPNARSNKTPSIDRLMLHALANHAIDQKNLPAELDGLLRRNPLPTADTSNLELISLIPSNQDIERLATSGEVKEDITIVDNLLKTSNEKPLSFPTTSLITSQIPHTEQTLSNKVLCSLLNILISQDQRIEKMEKEIDLLRDKLNEARAQRITID